MKLTEAVRSRPLMELALDARRSATRLYRSQESYTLGYAWATQSQQCLQDAADELKKGNLGLSLDYMEMAETLTNDLKALNHPSEKYRIEFKKVILDMTRNELAK